MPMKGLLLIASALVGWAVSPALAQSKPEACASYARQAAASAPTSTGPVRGAARGAVGGAIFGNAGTGAGAGALVGTARRANQKNQSYQFYYDQCMTR